MELVLAGTTVLVAGSRGASVATVVGLGIVPLTYARLRARQRIAALLTISTLVCGAFLFVPESSWERLSTTPNELAQGTLTGRRVIWAAGWELFREHPFLGVGANAFRIVVSRVLAEPIRADQDALPPAPPAHITFLSVLVEHGVIGFTLFCSLLSLLALSLTALPPFPRKLWIVCLGVWVVGVSSLTWELRKPTCFFFSLLIAHCCPLPQNRTPTIPPA